VSFTVARPVNALNNLYAVFGFHLFLQFAHMGRVLPNPSLKLTRYGMQRKPGVRRLRHLRTPGLHCMPPRAA
jgi:hypothetical protein